MPRTGMLPLIDELSRMCAAGTADHTIGTAIYWSSDTLQDAIDATRIDAHFAALEPLPLIASGGAIEVHDYAIPSALGPWIEQNATDSGWQVRDSAGSAIGTALYTVNYPARRITFSADTGGASYFLDARGYDLNRAASAIWRHKAAFAANRVAWSSGDHRLDADQEHAHCLSMAEHYARLAGPDIAILSRTDEMIE